MSAEAFHALQGVGRLGSSILLPGAVPAVGAAAGWAGGAQLLLRSLLEHPYQEQVVRRDRGTKSSCGWWCLFTECCGCCRDKRRSICW